MVKELFSLKMKNYVIAHYIVLTYVDAVDLSELEEHALLIVRIFTFFFSSLFSSTSDSSPDESGNFDGLNISSILNLFRLVECCV